MANQENLSIRNNSPGQPWTLVQPHNPPHACSGAFSFQPPRGRIDWRALQSVDLEGLVRSTDIDALERVLDVVAYGDIEAEDARNLTPLNFIKLFRIAQLTVDYLLFVQDRLAADNCMIKGELGRLQGHVQVLQLKVKEQREEVAAGRKELKHVKRTMRMLEALALAQKQQAPLPAPAPPPQQQPEVQVVEKVVEKVVEAADPVVQYKLERLEAEAGELVQEREAMRSIEGYREMLKLKDALATAHASSSAAIAAAVEDARRDERAAAEERIQAAVEQDCKARIRDSKSKLSVVADTEESCALRAKLAESLRRQRELEKQKDILELELVHAMGSPKRAASPSAQVRQLKAELEAAQAEIQVLQSLQSQGRPPSRGSLHRSSAARLRASGVGSMLEDTSEANDARAEQLQAEVDSLKAELKSALVTRAQLEQDKRLLLQDLKTVQQQLEQQQQQSVQKRGVWEAKWKEDRPDLQVPKATRDYDSVQHESGVRSAASKNAEAAQPLPAAAQSVSRPPPSPIKVQHVSSERETGRVFEVEAAGQAGLGSPIDQEALAGSDGESRRFPSPPPFDKSKQQAPSPKQPQQHGHQRQAAAVKALYRKDRLQRGSPASEGKERRGGECSPSPASWQQRFEEEMTFLLAGHERPGVVSRFPHSLESMMQMRRELLGELSTEVERELASYGISPTAQRLTDAQFRAAMAELEAQREVACARMSNQDRRRMDYMRQTITAHIDKVARRVERTQREEEDHHAVVSVPTSLKPIRVRSEEREGASCRPARPKIVVAGDAAGGPEPEAFYSPLRSGASQISFKSDSPGSPHALVRSTSGPLVLDDDGTPRSPWAITHDRVFHGSPSVGEAGSPLRQGARQSPLVRSGTQRGPGSPGPHGSRGGGRSPAVVELQTQRLPRRVEHRGSRNSSSRAAPGAAVPSSPGHADHSRHASPTRSRLEHRPAPTGGAAHRYSPDADAESPLPSPRSARQPGSARGAVRVRREGLEDSRDLSTDGAETVRPAAESEMRRSISGPAGVAAKAGR